MFVCIFVILFFIFFAFLALFFLTVCGMWCFAHSDNQTYLRDDSSEVTLASPASAESSQGVNQRRQTTLSRKRKKKEKCKIISIIK